MKDKELKQIAQLIAKQIASESRRQRSGPRSKIVEAIAVLLYARPMRAAEIAQVLGTSSRYVSSYLSYWRARGLFEYENGYWRLTPKGEEFAREVIERYTSSRANQYIALAKQILLESNQLQPARKDKEAYHPPGQYQQPLQFLAALTSKLDNERQKRSYCVRQVYAIYEPLLSPEEKEILKMLLDHYEKWGKTYTYLDQLIADLNADINWLTSMLKSLQTKGLIYIYRDRQMGVRIGLSKELKRILEDCLAEK